MTSTTPEDIDAMLPTAGTVTETSPSGTHLADGGFAPDMAIMTPGGPVTVADLTPGQRVFALDPVSRVVKPQRVAAVEAVPAPNSVVRIQTQRADLRVAPVHRIPFRTEATRRIRFQSAAALDKSYYKFVNEWRPRPGHELSTVDITDYLTEFEACATVADHGHTFRAALPDGCEPCRRNSHAGYYFDAATFKRHQAAIEAAADTVTVHAGPGHHRRPYWFDGEDFLALLGWFVTEGSIYRPDDRDTAQIKIAQDTPQHRERIAVLFDRLGIDVTTNDRRFEFGSVLFGRLFERLCGAESRSKRLPELVWECDPAQRRRLLAVLLRGDGNDRQTFYTTSDTLARDVMRLCVGLGCKPRFTRRGGIWQLYIRSVNDGFSQEHIRTVPAPVETLYRLTVSEYHTVLAGREGKFQWVGVSGVA